MAASAPTATIRSLLDEASAGLSAVSQVPALEAELLLGHVLSRGRASLLAHDDVVISEADCRRFRSLVAERQRHRPLAQLLGHREFWTLDLQVTPAVLTPRPETELLVELALERLPAGEPRRVLDLGTGTGAVALAIARERPGCAVTATDLSQEALAVARANATAARIANVDFRAGDWYRAVTPPLPAERFHLIVSNPPYIADDEWELTDPELRFEPRLALAAGPDGLDALRVIAAGAPAALEPGGWLLVEHGFRQGPAVAGLFRAAGLTEVDTFRDLAGHDRVTAGRAPA
jgi:release factor glutamine methyltransferase